MVEFLDVASPTKKMTQLPLNQKTILITRAAQQSSTFTNLLEKQGAEVVEMPALEICPPSNWQGLDEAIAVLQDFDWLILTSANGVNYFCDRLLSLGKSIKDLARMKIKIAVVGKKTSQYLQQRSLKADFIPSAYIADSLVEEFPEPLKEKKVLFPRVETGGRELLVKALSEEGAKVTEVPVYQSACPKQIPSFTLKAIKQQNIDIVTFASSKTVKNFHQLLKSNLLPAELDSFLSQIIIASIGPQTSLSCQEIFHRVDIEAEKYTLEGLTQAIVSWVTDKGTLS
ncbi:MAG: uroporphyrinogen-III synthase [Spirulinaceae cyanobacterium]